MRIEELKGVGKVRLEALHKAGLEDTEQLICRLPRDYTTTARRLDICTPVSVRCFWHA